MPDEQGEVELDAFGYEIGPAVPRGGEGLGELAGEPVAPPNNENRRVASYRERVEKARSAARTALESGARVHVWTTVNDFEVAPSVEGFELEGWDLTHFSTHFRHFDFGGTGWAVANIAVNKAKKRQNTGKWDSIGDAFVMLFRRRG